MELARLIFEILILATNLVFVVMAAAILKEIRGY